MSLDEVKLCMLMENGMWEHVDQIASQTIESNPGSSVALAAKGFLALKDDNFELAESFFMNALQLEPNGLIPRRGLYLIHFRKGRFSNAEKILIDLLNDYPDSPSMHASLCWLYVKFRKRQKAEQAISVALGLHPTNQEVLTAQLYFARENLDGHSIIRLSKELIEIYPDNCLAHLCLGFQFFLQNDLNAAEAHFRTGMEIEPNEVCERLLKIIEFRRTGRHGVALILYTIRRKLLKLLVPGYARKDRMGINWNRRAL